MMNFLIGIAGVALLFIVFGVMSRGRRHERCAECGGGCASRDPHPLDTSDRRSPDAHT
jgi:hypothetical protein